jgi:hypothetical protein
MGINDADVAELVDARDLKSLDGNVVWVRVPPPAPAFAMRATARHASPSVEREGCRAVARRAKADWCHELGKPEAPQGRGERSESEDGRGEAATWGCVDAVDWSTRFAMSKPVVLTSWWMAPSRCGVQRRSRYGTLMPESRVRPPHHLHRPRRPSTRMSAGEASDALVRSEINHTSRPEKGLGLDVAALV